ncbi:helix-turn-helix transcriptional regulator [Rossellomorea sp. y25]|uniref:helix-turn-helix transcriptional regulator n=1 Tax=Rossellomorea sp. y25 TaxID=3118174 RepID=UPI0030DF52CC
MFLAERIRQLRIHKGMNQSELVEGICSITYLSRIENGKIKPSKAFLHKISEKLDVAIEYLTDNDITNFEATIQETIDHYKVTNHMSEREISFLEIHSMEMHPVPVLLQIHGVLLHYYVRINSMKNTDRIYTNSLKLLPDRVHEYYPEDSMFYYIACGNYFYQKQNFHKADDYYSEADRLMEDDESIQRAHLYYNLGLVKQRLNKKQDISRHYTLKAYKLYKRFENTTNIISVLITLGVQYHLDQMFEEAKDCLSKAKSLVDEYHDNTFEGMIEYNYGRVYQGMKEFDQAIVHFKKSLTIHKGNDKERIYSLRGLVEVYSELKEWNLANTYLNEAIEIVETLDLRYLYVDIHALVAELYKVRRDDYNYEKEMQQLIHFSLDHQQFLLAKKHAVTLGDHYYNVNAYKMAAKYYQIALKNDNKVKEAPKIYQ